MPDATIKHDKDLFLNLFAEARRCDPKVRSGSMFGCPAVFYGRKMAACVYGESIGLKVPAEVASDSLRTGRAISFRPYGKPAMREWIQIDGGADTMVSSLDLLAAAVAFAKANNGREVSQQCRTTFPTGSRMRRGTARLD